MTFSRVTAAMLLLALSVVVVSPCTVLADAPSGQGSIAPRAVESGWCSDHRAPPVVMRAKCPCGCDPLEPGLAAAIEIELGLRGPGAVLDELPPPPTNAPDVFVPIDPLVREVDHVPLSASV